MAVLHYYTDYYLLREKYCKLLKLYSDVIFFIGN